LKSVLVSSLSLSNLETAQCTVLAEPQTANNFRPTYRDIDMTIS
jgi:hypothetical protein